MNNNHLQIPDAAIRDPESLEILRVWIANADQHVSLRGGVWQDPAAWGLMLADIARHVASSYREDMGFDRYQALKRIKAAFDIELASPTERR